MKQNNQTKRLSILLLSIITASTLLLISSPTVTGNNIFIDFFFGEPEEERFEEETPKGQAENIRDERNTPCSKRATCDGGCKKEIGNTGVYSYGTCKLSSPIGGKCECDAGKKDIEKLDDPTIGGSNFGGPIGRDTTCEPSGSTTCDADSSGEGNTETIARAMAIYNCNEKLKKCGEENEKSLTNKKTECNKDAWETFVDRGGKGKIEDFDWILKACRSSDTQHKSPILCEITGCEEKEGANTGWECTATGSQASSFTCKKSDYAWEEDRNTDVWK